MTENNKLCPLKLVGESISGSVCEGEACACYIKLVKPRYVETGKYRFIDPEYFYSYAGCGLVTQIPWELVERKRKPETVEEQTKGEAP